MHEKETSRPVELEEDHDSFFTDVYPLVEKLAPNSTLLLDWDDVVLIRDQTRKIKAVRPGMPDFISAIKLNRPDIKIFVLTASTRKNSHITEGIGRPLGIDGEYIYMEDIMAALYYGPGVFTWAEAYATSFTHIPTETMLKITDNIRRFVDYNKPTSLIDGSPITVEQILADLETEPTHKLHYMFLLYVQSDGSLIHFLVDDFNAGYEAEKLGIGFHSNVVHLAGDM